MPQGTISFLVFGLIFFGLQIYWISQTLKDQNSKSRANIKTTDQLSEKKKELEKIFKK